ncbi:MAG: flagellar FlbD family protein [Oligoflexia bacterium]|nr:flagellar FlbD family protein [Oligoflexia bacterium]
MIDVERVNGQKMFINPDLIKFIEITPDTVVTFTDGEKILLRTKPDEIMQKIILFRRLVGLPELKL